MGKRSDTPRSTTDVDAGLDIRAHPTIATTATRALRDLGFQPEVSTTDGKAVRWLRGDTEVDVLVPAHLGREVRDVDDAAMLASHGVQQALERSQSITLVLSETAQGTIRRPTLYGAVIAKAAALANGSDARPERHLDDLNFLLTLLKPRHMKTERVRGRDLFHLQFAVQKLDQFGYLQDAGDPAREALEHIIEVRQMQINERLV